LDSLAVSSRYPLFKATPHTPWEMLTIVAGTLIVVQGFETPRYLEAVFKADVRVRASRWSQIISTGVYLLFVALAMSMTLLAKQFALKL